MISGILKNRRKRRMRVIGSRPCFKGPRVGLLLGG